MRRRRKRRTTMMMISFEVRTDCVIPTHVVLSYTLNNNNSKNNQNSCPNNRNIKINGTWKISTTQDLSLWIQTIWNVKAAVIPEEICALGNKIFVLECYLNKLPRNWKLALPPLHSHPCSKQHFWWVPTLFVTPWISQNLGSSPRQRFTTS